MSAVLAEVTSRIAALTSIMRTSEDDVRRTDLHGTERDERIQKAADGLRKIASDLEKAVA